jgi:hypothetical protein
MQIGNNSSMGGFMYLDDVSVLSVTSSSVTATLPMSVDSRFTVTAMGLTGSYTNYNIDVTNCNPYITSNPYNQNMFNPAERIVINPDFQNSWCTIGNLGASGTFECSSFYRLFRISNISGINVNFKAYVFAEKQIPVIQ